MVHPTRFGRDTLTPERSRTFEGQVPRYVVTFQVLRMLRFRAKFMCQEHSYFGPVANLRGAKDSVDAVDGRGPLLYCQECH